MSLATEISGDIFQTHVFVTPAEGTTICLQFLNCRDMFAIVTDWIIGKDEK